MGLTIHFRLCAPPGTDSTAALGYVRQLHSFCQDRPFAEVDRQVAHLAGASDCDFEPSDTEQDPLRWLKIQARTSIKRRETLYHPDADDLRVGYQVGSTYEVHYDVGPVEIIGFSAWPGEGCESLELGLASYPETITFWDHRHSRRPRRRVLNTRLGDRWRWRAFCKTQYASEQGLVHFLRCHLLVIAVLDRAKELRVLHRVSDEGHYWKQRRLDELAGCVHSYNALIGGLHKLMQAAVPGGVSVQAEIEKHPDYERFTLDQLAAEFPELKAAVERMGRVIRAARE